MPLPTPQDTCLELEIDLAAFLELAIDLPGGISLQAKLEPGKFPSLSAIVNSVLEPLNAALTPLMPFFRLLELALAIVEFCKAVPDSLGPPPDPTVLVAALEKVLKSATKVAAMIPPLSIPIMIVGICRVIVAALLALIGELENVIEVQTKIDLARDRAAVLATDPALLIGAAALEVGIDCAQADLDLQLEVSFKSLGPLNKFLDLLNAFMDLAGLPQLLKVEASGDAAGMLQPLRDGVLAIEAICNALPV